MKSKHLLVPLLLSLCVVVASWGGHPASPNSVLAQGTSTAPMLYSSAPDAPDSHLQAILDDTVGNHPGNWGVAVKKLDTGQYAAFNGDQQQVTASLYKLWVVSDLYHQVAQGLVSLDDTATVEGDDMYEDSVSGDLRFSEGDTITLGQAAYDMITLSDNTCAHLLVRVLDPENINSFMQHNGLTHSYLDWYSGGDNYTTPLDVLHELELMATSKMVDAQSSREMVEMMLDQQINDILPPGLPDGVMFAHKTGALDSLLHDAGIVYGPSGPFIIVFMASNLNSYQDVYDSAPALISRVYDYFNSQPSSPALYFPETRQTVGHDFLKFWEEYGGVDTFGYPIGPEELRDGMLVQEFERARFEWHTNLENSGGIHPWVVLGLLGQERADQLGLKWQPTSDPGTGQYFPQTGQAVTGAFYDYWNNHGGERVFGWPISPAENMVNPSDGKTYYTQWFQRARMEIHTDLPEGHRIVLGAIGTELDANNNNK